MPETYVYMLFNNNSLKMLIKFKNEVERYKYFPMLS